MYCLCDSENLFEAKLTCSPELFDFQIGSPKDGVDYGGLCVQEVDSRIDSVL